MSRRRVLITGAAGSIGRMLATRLARPGRVLRLLDVLRQDDAPSGTEVVTASVTDRYAMRAACRGVDAVVHLAGIPTEAPWADILATNVDGTQCVLEAARLEGVPRLVLASSIHAAGFQTRDLSGAGSLLPADVPARPDTYYGMSKAALESLGALYHARFDMQIVCLRIGSCQPRPERTRQLASWLSPDDAGRLVEAAIGADRPGFTVVWGISHNTRRWWSLDAGEAIGYRPRDDAERYAAKVLAACGDLELDVDEMRHVGGEFCALPLGVPPTAAPPAEDGQRPSVDDQDVAADRARA